MSSLCKAMFAGIGLNPSKYSTHSLRAGGATAASNANVPMAHWMEQGNWRSLRAAQGYVKTDDSHKLQVAQAIMGASQPIPTSQQPPRAELQSAALPAQAGAAPNPASDKRRRLSSQQTDR